VKVVPQAWQEISGQSIYLHYHPGASGVPGAAGMQPVRNMSDEILSYPARWVLKYGDKKDLAGLENDN